jgi:cysteinyl-tRNA synthetase
MPTTNYLSLSNQKLEDLFVAEDADLKFKKDPKDFALWKAAKKDEPSWPTPWGDGRPGWHIECSAMAHAYLGESFDIHGGGLDLIFPHHENEIAQSNAAGFGFANIWMHNAWVTTSGEKMSKSLGNSLQVAEILKKVRGIELRWYLGSAHYRSMLEFSFEALAESATAFKRIEAFLSRAESILGKEVEPLIADDFAKAMNDDLAVPQALAFIAESMRIGNISAEDKKVIAKTAGEIRGALSVLGCDPKDAAFAATQSNNDAIDGLIKLALEQREAARLRKDFAAADQIRDQIASLGITVEDTTNGPRWSY